MESDPDAAKTTAESVDQLLVRTAEEEEMEAQGLNSSNEAYDDDFLIMEEVNEDDEAPEKAEPLEKKEASPDETPKPDLPAITVIQLDDDEVGEKGDAPSTGEAEESEKAVVEEKKEMDVEEPQVASTGVSGEVVAAEVGKEAAIEVDKKVDTEVDKKVDVAVGKKVDTKVDKKVNIKVDKKIDNKVDKEVDIEVGKKIDTKVDKKVDMEVDKKADIKEDKKADVEAGKKLNIKVDKSVDIQVDKKLATEGDKKLDIEADKKKRRRLASGYASLADLKRALGMTEGSDATSDGSKRLKFEDDTECKSEEGGAGAGPNPPAVGIPVGPNLVVLSRAQLEAYVAQRVRECLALQGQAVLQPMEKKCDALHRALERWRRRSFQLQKQLNEFVCEQERCAGARRNRRSVGVCVRMPPLKQPTVTQMVSRPAMSTANSVATTVANRPTQLTQGTMQQLRVTGAGASNLAAQLGFKPNQAMKLVSVSTPSGGTTTVVTRLPPQLQVAGSGTPTTVPVPMQLIANTAATPSQQVKSVSLPGSPMVSGGGTVVRTVAVVSSASSTPTTASQTVKFIDLTQEEEGGQSKVISMPTMTMAGNTVQKISMPTSAIPMLSAAPTSLVQVTASPSQPVLRTATAVSVSSGVVTQSGGGFRLTQSMTPPRVTYLVPSLPPGMVVTPKESGPRLISAGTPTSGTAMPMQTILLRMASPQGGFTTVPGGAITMGSLTPMPGVVGAGQSGAGTTMMVQTPAGSQVRMIRAPPPLSLPRGGTTLTLPPGTTLVRGPPSQGGGVTLVGGVGAGPSPSPTTMVRVPVPVQKPTVVVEAKSSSPAVVPAVTAAGAPVVPVGPPVLGRVDTPASATAPPPAATPKHPAPLPPTARYLDDPKKKRLPPKPALKITKAASVKQDPAVHMDQVLEQWQAFLNTPEDDSKSNGAGSSGQTATAATTEEGKGSAGPAMPKRRMRMPYHTLRPLRLACLCRLGTCRYDKLSASFKERLHADFGRLQPEKQLRLLVARMYSEGLVRSKVPRKGRCKWMYWLPRSGGSGHSKCRVCKAGFMAVHGITEKRVRDVQLLWMRLRQTRGSTPTGDESELENESYLADVVDVDEKDPTKLATTPRKPAPVRRGSRKILRESSSEDSSRDAEDEYEDDNDGDPDVNRVQQVYKKVEEAQRKQQARAAKTRASAAKTEDAGEEDDEEKVAGGGDDDDNDDEEEAPFMDISAFEPICSLEEDTENLVLSLPRG
ncbi:unnamed protein product, partial [Ixodes hexagonus]